MSEKRSMAEDILDGIFCEECGQYIGDPVGHPRKCLDCKPAHKKPKQKPVKVGKPVPRTNFGGPGGGFYGRHDSRIKTSYAKLYQARPRVRR